MTALVVEESPSRCSAKGPSPLDPGLDVQIGDGSVDVEPTNVDDIVNEDLGDGHGQIDGEALRR